MGTTEEENAYRQQQEQAATQAHFDKIQREQEMAARQAAEEEAARKAAEDALVNGTGSGQSKMTAATPAAVTWPNDVQAPATPGVRDQVAGALRVGKAGDAAFARDLLNSGQAPFGSVGAQETANGAKEHAGGAGARAPKPALGLG